jgi:hypothetical protein
MPPSLIHPGVLRQQARTSQITDIASRFVNIELEHADTDLFNYPRLFILGVLPDISTSWKKGGIAYHITPEDAVIMGFRLRELRVALRGFRHTTGEMLLYRISQPEKFRLIAGNSFKGLHAEAPFPAICRLLVEQGRLP